MKRNCQFLLLATMLALAPAIAASPLTPRLPANEATVAELPAATPVELIVVKFHEGTAVRLRDGALAVLPRQGREDTRLAALNLDAPTVEADLYELQAILASTQIAQGLSRLFSPSEEELASYRASGETKSGRELADLDLYYRVAIEPGLTVGETQFLVDALNGLASVELAYAHSPPVPPVDIPPITPDFEGGQEYLDPAPLGIDSRYAWTLPGGRGAGVTILDIEKAWNFSHEDLPTLLPGGGTPISDPVWFKHGTAVLGELVAQNNGYGVTGIAHQSTAGYQVCVDGNASAPHILTAAMRAGAGNLVLIELQVGGIPTPASGCENSGSCCDCVPVEDRQAEFDAISTATANGVIVVEAGANGATDLDDPLYAGRFNRTLRDSGAILVGASLSSSRKAISFTNFGSRIDVHAWGEHITTTGWDPNIFNGNLDVNQHYTATFGGTSGASPIVTGAAALLQGITRAAGRADLDPLEVRQLLRETGTPQVAGPKQIGPMPNLRAAADFLLAYDAEMLAPTVAATMFADGSYVVTVPVKNVGNASWSTLGAQCGALRLGSANPYDNATWGLSRVDLPAVVPSQGSASLTFNVTAPATAGTYNFQWRMHQECTAWFGDLSPNVVVTVLAPPPRDAVFLAQSVPLAMVAGEWYPVSLTVKNLGTQPWSVIGSGSQAFRLGSANPQGNFIWGLGRVDLPATVSPGETSTLSFMIRAPSAAGSYNFQWQMLQEGVEWFGTPSANAVVTVSARLPRDARFVSQKVPTSMVAGQTYAISMRVRNVGTSPWDTVGPQCDAYRLGAANPQGTTRWGTVRAELPGTVAPGQEADLNFTITAPAVGTYNFQWQMVRECDSWFGEPSPNVSVVVRAGAAKDAQILAQTVPSTMVAGQSYAVSMRVKNVGTASWNLIGPFCDAYRLGAANPQGTARWGTVRAELPTTLAPGEETTLQFYVTAPATLGTYNFQWQMVRECDAWFGDPSPNQEVVVRPGLARDAQILEQTVPSTMVTGQSYTVSARVKNVGTQAWSLVGPQCDAYRLGASGPQGNTTWGTVRAELPAPLGAGQEVVLTFNVTAPAGNVAYNFQWQMVEECQAWFGDLGPSRLVAITP